MTEKTKKTSYLYQFRWSIAILLGITLLVHGSTLFSQCFGVDTELYIDGITNSDLIGRPALSWLSSFLQESWYNPYYIQALTLIFMAFTPVAFGYVFHKSSPAMPGRMENAALLLLGSSFIVSPFWTAQIYFTFQGGLVLLGCILLAFAMYLAEQARCDLKKKWFFLFISVAFLQIAFSCYQVLAFVYVAAVAAFFLVTDIKKSFRSQMSASTEKSVLTKKQAPKENVSSKHLKASHLEDSFKAQLSFIGFHILVFLIGLAAHWIIAKLFYMGAGDYLGDQIAWTSMGKRQVLSQCLAEIKNSLKSTAPYYTGVYGLFCVLFLAVMAIYVHWQKERTALTKAVNLLSSLFLAGSPYLLILVYGGRVWDRMQLVLPLAQGCMLYLSILLLSLLWPDKILVFPRRQNEGTAVFVKSCIFPCLLSLFLLCSVLKDAAVNFTYCARFYYTNDWIFDYDTRMAQKIYEDLRTVRAENGLEDGYDNILFLGYPDVPYNAVCMKGDIIGSSLFQYGYEQKGPVRVRIEKFMKNIGYPLPTYYAEGEIAAFHYYFDDVFGETVDAMPSYPQTGYLQYLSDSETGLNYLVIKLGGDWRSCLDPAAVE